MNNNTMFLLLIIIIALALVLIVLQLVPIISKIATRLNKRSSYNKLGESSKIRLIHQINDAVIDLSKARIGAIITIVKKDPLDRFRTDGIKIDANLSSSLILAIFNKNSPLHDGAIIIEDNRIKYAATYYRITSKSVSNHFGARHRAALGISEHTDAITIVISETNGSVTFAIDGKFVIVKASDFQEKLTAYLNKM